MTLSFRRQSSLPPPRSETFDRSRNSTILRRLGANSSRWYPHWLGQPSTHVCVVCGREVVRDRCHAFPQAGLERIRAFEQRQREDHVVGHPFHGILWARLKGIGGANSREQFGSRERTRQIVQDMIHSKAPSALRCRIGDSFVAPLLCSQHEQQFGAWERKYYSARTREFWQISPPTALFCLAYRTALRYLYLRQGFIRIFQESADHNLQESCNDAITALEAAHTTFVSAMNGQMSPVDGRQPGHAVYAGITDRLLPFAGSGVFTYSRSAMRPEESYIGLLLPIALRQGSHTLVLLWQTRGKTSDLAAGCVDTWKSSPRTGRDDLLGLFFGSADQVFISPAWWRGVPYRIRADVTSLLFRPVSRLEEKAISLDNTVAPLSRLWYLKDNRFYSARYTEIRRHSPSR